MRFATRLLVSAALAASLLAAASAAPITADLIGLQIFVTTARNAILPSAPTDELKQRAALTKALAAFNASSQSLDGDVRIFGRVATAIQGAGIADSDSALENALLTLHGDVVPKRDALAARIDPLVSPKLLAAAKVDLVEIDASLNTAAAGPGSFSSRAKALRAAIARIAAAGARITKGTAPRGTPSRPGIGYFAAFLDGVGFVPTFGSGRVTFLDGLPSEVDLTGYSLPASKGGIEFQWSTGSFTGAGDYALDGTSGAIVILVKDGKTFYSEGGVVTVTTFDVMTRTIAGTYEVQFTSNSNEKLALTKGTFDVRRFKMTTVTQ